MPNDATEQVRKDWDSQANSWYEERTSLLAASRPIHEWLVEHLESRDGQRVLEIAAGPGDTGFLAATRLGGVHLVSTDLAPSMVDAARKRGAELGIQNVDYRVLDAQSMDLDDASFDGVICRWGLMLMPDPAAALRECRRVLRSSGRLVFAVFTGPDENPFASIPARILTDAGYLPRPTSEWQPGILALADRGRLQALLDDVGFTSTHIESVDMTWTFATPDDYWSFLVKLTALGPLVRSLPNEARAAVRDAIDARLAVFTHAGGIALPSRCWCGVATR
ncbi:MAG TPA: methyltransferase domain-containing protein [Gemmatimonadaceae bacterium]